MKHFLLTTMLGAGLMATGLSAETKIQERRENQQDRIAQGVKSGELTPRETARLENQEARLNRQIRRDRRRNGGNLTNKEKRQINREQNQLSREIYKEKHDAQKQH